MVFKQDEVGNKIIVELYKEHSAIYIKLASESVKRLIGNVLFKERTLFIERNSAKHLMRKGNAYGFNHYILANAKQFDFVIMYEEDTKQYYRIEREYMLKEGKFMFFKQQGFEKQIFLTKEWIEFYHVTSVQNIATIKSMFRF